MFRARERVAVRPCSRSLYFPTEHDSESATKEPAGGSSSFAIFWNGYGIRACDQRRSQRGSL